jgi:hypothetical protein
MTFKSTVSASTYTLPAAVALLGAGVAPVGVVAMAALSALTTEWLLVSESAAWALLPKDEMEARTSMQHPLVLSEVARKTFPDLTFRWASLRWCGSADRMLQAAPMVVGSRQQESVGKDEEGGSGELVVVEVAGDAEGDDAGGVNVMEVLVAASNVINAVGSVAAYISFATNVLPTAAPVSSTAALLLATAVVLLLAHVPDLKWLAFTSSLGTAAVAAGIISVLAVGASGGAPGADGDLHPAELAPAPQSALVFFAFLGRLSFLFGSHPTALPVAQSMKSRALGPAMFRTAYSASAVVNTVFAVFGALLFGAATHANIVTNLASGSVVIRAVKVFMCVDCVCMAPVIISPAREVLEKLLPKPFTSSAAAAWARYFFTHAVPTLVALAIAFAVPDFARLVSLCGGLSSCFVAYILPPLLVLRLAPVDSLAWSLGRYATITFGVVTAVGAVIASLV